MESIWHFLRGVVALVLVLGVSACGSSSYSSGSSSDSGSGSGSGGGSGGTGSSSSAFTVSGTVTNIMAVSPTVGGTTCKQGTIDSSNKFSIELTGLKPWLLYFYDKTRSGSSMFLGRIHSSVWDAFTPGSSITWTSTNASLTGITAAQFNALTTSQLCHLGLSYDDQIGMRYFEGINNAAGTCS